ncbi:MAG: site-specific DNA-methyltransferase [Bacteroidales bacterium]|nr:site-specific DNA-methyltransferase [Bacteroidales bacterium]
MEENKVNIEVVSIDDLVQDDHNFNKGNEQGAQLLERSFRECGAGRSVLIDKDNRLVGGNKAQKGFKAAGKKKVIIVDSDADTLVAVRRKDVSLDSAEGRKMAYLDNLTTQVNLTWDETELQAVQADVEGFDIADFGIDLGLPTGDPDEADKVTEDDFDPDAHYEPISKPGDLWQLGNHRLMCGDSTKKEDVAKLMQGELAHLWLTDPPYNVAVKNSQGMTIANDNMASDEFRIFLRNAFAAAYPVLDKGCPFYVWFASKEHINFEGALNDVGLQVRQELIWNKNHFILGRAHYQWKHEPCLYGWKGDSCRYFIDVRNRASVIEDNTEIDIDKMKKADMQKLLHDILDNKTPTTVINCMKPNKDEDHPTMKPVRLFGYQIANSSRPGNIILDTFGGSGTTIVACEQLGRKARLMELDPHYCDVIIARWEKLTGGKAVKLNP